VKDAELDFRLYRPEARSASYASISWVRF